MILNKQKTKEHLQSANLQTLFIEELGWDNPSGQHSEEIKINEKRFSLIPIAEKRGVKIFRCNEIPDRQIRYKIEKEITKKVFEHLIIFINQHNKRQIWQWVSRQKGKPDIFREHDWLTHTSEEPLLQKLEHITFSLEEESLLTLNGATLRLRNAFDREKLTKKFYDVFKKQHENFLDAIDGLNDTNQKRWYASLMLNRLMFVYFIQKKRFLDGDINYLKNRLSIVKNKLGNDKFYSFYRTFLLKLFHDGLAKPSKERKAENVELLGQIPYLNGGLFDPHILEKDGNKIHIPDSAFEKIFNFFDQYEWTLNTKAIDRDDGKEINPDVLGHIFEKYVNQKEMGAFYTNEDISDYITKNTLIPWLFSNSKKLDSIAFKQEGFIWRMLSENAKAYFYPEVSYGVDRELPENIKICLNDINLRKEWNNKSDTNIGLPTEIWRETLYRRKKYFHILDKIKNGKISKIEDFLTYNLNIRQFSQDIIQFAESPDIVRAFWESISSIKILDPSCGSGAFLFAALEILYDLYDACLDRMEQFVSTSPNIIQGQTQLYSDFRRILTQLSKHPNRPYFIYKSIIISNLYGVDIMEEAIEICKLRLFLKLASQLESVDQIEPLPDIDFNIKAGNSLIGYASFDDIKFKLESSGFDFENKVETIKNNVTELEKDFRLFRQQQTDIQGQVDKNQKLFLQSKLNDLGKQLDQNLAENFGIIDNDNLASNANFQEWRKSYKPFNWLIEFSEIINNGGFDVIIGNPPYLESREVNYKLKNLRTSESNAIHAFFVERSNDLLTTNGTMSMILPISLVSTQRMKIVQEELEKQGSTWYSNFAWRPAKLFDQVNRALTIFVSLPTEESKVFSTGYMKWLSSNRSYLMPSINYEAVPSNRVSFWVPKFQNSLEHNILKKIQEQKLYIEEIRGPGDNNVYYRTTGGLYWKIFTNFSPKFFINNKPNKSSRETKLTLRQGYDPLVLIALLSSSTYWWWYSVTSNLRDLNPSDILNFKTNQTIFQDPALLELGQEYIKDLEKNSVMLKREQKQTGITKTQSFKIQKSKPIIDKIDEALSIHYGFNLEELDFIKNYDIKYRLTEA